MLTPRQAEIGVLVAKGMSNKAIAREIGISRRTVEDHLAEAAARIPGSGGPRHKCMVWYFSLDEDAGTP